MKVDRVPARQNCESLKYRHAHVVISSWTAQRNKGGIHDHKSNCKRCRYREQSRDGP